MNKSPIIVVGIGEMGSVFARGFMRLGHPVFPVTRDTDINALASELPNPQLVLVAVGEATLQDTLKSIPSQWSNKLALLQNELLPKDYAHINNPTVISVWFEKKKGQDSKPLIPSPSFGPQAQLLVDALKALDIPARSVASADAMNFELVVKNVYIVTTNVAGLRVGGDVGTLWKEYASFARDVANDVIDIQDALTEQTYDRGALIATMLEAFEGDLEHKCMGRSAPARLERAIAHADNFGLSTPTLRAIAQETQA